MEYGFTLNCDWISFTWNPVDDIIFESDNRSIIELFLLRFPEFQKKEFTVLEHGGFHYSKRIDLANDIMILYDDADSIQKKGVYVQTPSHGLATLFALFGYNNLRDFLIDIYDRGAKVSRFDLAFDDYIKTYNPMDYMNFWINGQFKSHFRRYEFSGGSNGGSMFALGNRGSNKYLRIYDKSAESKGEKDCIRYEFELKGYDADKICRLYCDDIAFDFSDFIFSMFQIVENTSDHHKCRRNMDSDWELWVKSQVSRINDIDIPTEFTPVSYERSYNWFVKQCGSTLAKIWHCEGDDWLDNFLEQSLLHLKDKDLKIIKDVLSYKKYYEKVG